MTDIQTPPLPLAFVDTETTSLQANRRAWEVAILRREYDPDGTPASEKTTWIIIEDLDLSYADPTALRIGRFYDRHPAYNRKALPDLVDGRSPEVLSEWRASKVIEHATRGAVIVGVNPTFDVITLERMLTRHKLAPAWHYSPVDVKSMAIAHGGRPGMKSDDLSRLVGVEPPTVGRHTALGDAMWARDLYDALATRLPTSTPPQPVAKPGTVTYRPPALGPTPASLAHLGLRTR